MSAFSFVPKKLKENKNIAFCIVCKFPAGKHINNQTGERRYTELRKGKDGYICNNCISEGRAIPMGKMTKAEKKKWKKTRRGL